MTNYAIQVQGLSKQFRLGEQTGKRYKALRDVISQAASRLFRRSTNAPKGNLFWALKDVSFNVDHGEVLGIIGRNGAGKSTLLKVLTRITEPTEGEVRLRGRVGSLLEVGTGFHPELTGRENIFLNGAILGMHRRDIVRRFDEIVAFAEIEQFIDTPAKRYSSGMYMRLAFAVAAHLEPEILLVDEVLAVGDAAFQKKCLGKMGDVAKSGRTVLFVSHNMAAVESLCQRGLLLERGQIRFLGSQTEAISQYLRSNNNLTFSVKDRLDRRGTGDITVTDIQFRDTDGNVIDTAVSGQDVDVYLYYKMKPGFSNSRVRVSVWFITQMGAPVFLHHNRLIRYVFPELAERGAFVCRVKRLPLTANAYQLTYSVMVAEEYYLDMVENACELTVSEGDFYGYGEIPMAQFGPSLVDAEWRLATLEEVH